MNKVLKKSDACDQAGVVAYSNGANSTFYVQVTPEGLQELAAIAGLDDDCDVDALEPYWRYASSILEVGAGYGRVIQALRSRHYVGKLTAIERSGPFFEYLKESCIQQAELLNADIHHFCQTGDKFDLILFLWSGIQDFLPEEQFQTIIDLTGLLQEGGKLIIDTLPGDVVPLGANIVADDVYQLSYKGTKVYIHNITNAQIERYGIAAGLSHLKHVKYQTHTGRDRVLHVLS